MKRYLNLVGLIGAWIVIFGIFSYLAPQSFPTASNVENLMRQVVITGFGTIGMTYIIMTGGIDLSAGSVVALVTVVIALALNKGQTPVVAAAFGITTGLLCGYFNGILISRLKVGAFIVTLAGLEAFRGAAKGLANEQKVNAPLSWLNDLTAVWGRAEKWKLFCTGAWMMLFCAAIASWALRYTVFGRHVVAIGSNEQAARLSGVRVPWVKVGVYALGGLTFGLAGLMQFSHLTVGDPTVAVGLELDIIAAVVIGGASLSGGEGSIFGSLIGALIMTTIKAGGVQMDMQRVPLIGHLLPTGSLPNWVQEIATGMIILIAVGFDRWRTARAAAKAA